MNNLVEKERTVGTPPLGMVSTRDFTGARALHFDDSSTGTKTIPSL